MPKVSVIIPVYNVEKYLRECLDSVINQTLKDIEIICIDDGSTDSSLSILKEYAKKDKRIKIIKQKNLGAGAARNKGIKIAKGEFVIFLDSDDYYPTNDILKILYTNAKKHKVLICGGSFSHLLDNKIISIFKDTSFGYIFNQDKIIKYKEYQFDYGYHRFIYNRDFLVKNKLLFPDYKRFQDPPFFVKAMYKAKQFYAVSKTTYLFRIGHKEVIWTTKKKRDLLKGITDNFNFAKKHKLDILYSLTYERLYQHFKIFTFKDIFTTQLYKTIKSIDYELIYKANLVQKVYNHLLLKFISQNIFSIRNSDDKKHKIITLFGLKIKIKRRNKHA